MNRSLVWNYFDITGLKYDKRFTICLCKEANMKAQKNKVFASQWHEIYCKGHMSDSSTYTWHPI